MIAHLSTEKANTGSSFTKESCPSRIMGCVITRADVDPVSTSGEEEITIACTASVFNEADDPNLNQFLFYGDESNEENPNQGVLNLLAPLYVVFLAHQSSFFQKIYSLFLGSSFYSNCKLILLQIHIITRSYKYISFTRCFVLSSFFNHQDDRFYNIQRITKLNSLLTLAQDHFLRSIFLDGFVNILR